MRLINADAVIEILKGNKQFFIDAWGGSFHAMSEKAKARYDEIDNCIAVILNAPTIEPDSDTISRQGAINAIENTDCELTTKDWDELTGALKSLPSAPSAEAESRLYIKIYVDDEPSVMAEKLYQICGETQNREVAEWLKEYFPSAPDSRHRGEWIFEPKDAIELMFTKPKCSECGFESADGGNFCSNCGADMRKEESEEDHDYERAVDQMEHDILYEPTYNPEDGSM